MSRIRSGLLDLGAILAYVTIASMAHWKLVYQGLILADYDAFVYFYTNREYTAARLLEGQLPLWNPYVFAGIPHLANPQSAVFYPGTWIFLLLPTPYAYTVNLVLHTAIAGGAMFGFLRGALQTTRAAALLAGMCYMLSGAITAQGGHLNQLSAAALLPVILLAAQRGVTGSSVRWASATAFLLGLQLLAGHPQVTYMTLVLMGLMLLWEIAGSDPGRWLRQALLLVLAGVLAMGLSMVQIIPTLEATRMGIRSGGMSLGEATASSLPPELLPLALLPGYSENPPSTEFLGFVGASGLILAVIGASAAMTGRQSWLIGAAALSLVIALGKNSAVFESLFVMVPGMDSFRVPARWLLPWSFCVSVLAGLSLNGLRQERVPRRILALLLAAVPIALAVWAGGLPEVAAIYPVPTLTVQTWIALLVGVGLVWLMSRARGGVIASTLLLLVVIGELLVARTELPFSHAVPLAAWNAESSTVQALRTLPPSSRILSIAGDGYQPAMTGALRARYPELTGYSFDQLVTAFKWADVQAPNLPSLYRLRSVDGYDGGVFPLRRFVLAASLFHPLGDVRPDGVLISSLDVIPRASALDLFAVEAIIASFEKDTEIDGVAFDRAVPARIPAGQSQVISELPEWTAPKLMMLLGVADGAILVGEPFLEIDIRRIDGQQTIIPLMAGVGAPLVSEVSAGRATGKVVPPWRASSGAPATVLVEIPLGGGPVEQLELHNVSSGTTVYIAGVTLVGGSLDQRQPIMLDPTLEIRDVGDARIYSRKGGLERAYLSHHAVPMTDDEAIVAMFEPDWNPSRTTFLTPGETPLLGAPSGTDRVTVVRSLPEEVALTVETLAPALLVLSDPWFPGWFVEIDGQHAPLLRANIHFRAVAVPGGRHDVRFVYDPATLKLGAGISAVTFGLFIVLAILGPRRLRWLP
ncbi:MAG: YfhO family protein [Chloroflexota bacterium]